MTGDILETDSLCDAVDGIDVVFHLAARISIDGDPDGQVWAVNVDGTRNVVEACVRAGIERLVHVSSFHALRQTPIEDPLTEERPFVGASGFAYDRSKAAGEREVSLGIKQGLSAVILSPTAILGPHDDRPSLMGQVLIDLYHGRLPSLVPGGADWVDARDVCDAALASVAIPSPATRYLVAGGWTSLDDLTTLAASITGRSKPRITTPMWLANVGVPFVRLYSRWSGKPPRYTRESLDHLARSNRRVSTERAARDLGFRPRPLRTTLEDTYAWLRAAGRLR